MYDGDTKAVNHLPETLDVFDIPPVGDHQGPIIKNPTQMLHVSLSPTRDRLRRAHLEVASVRQAVSTAPRLLFVNYRNKSFRV